ncbi:hypothetical protein [Lysobacter capsici]|uniref:hypothetical protein n=1 Tax=Lysobacter capsici TaxID=435897 RepID=UPI00128B528B|nr:hypothetical protein [Lysobacter capsici]
MWRMPAQAPHLRALDSQKSIFLWLPFFCCFRQKKVTRRFSGGTLFDPACSFKDFKALKILSFLSQRQDQQLSSASGRVTFFCQKRQKKGNQRKTLFCESRARAIGVNAGMRHTGHPVPVAHGAHPCAPPFGCAFVNASSLPRSAGCDVRNVA